MAAVLKHDQLTVLDATGRGLADLETTTAIATAHDNEGLGFDLAQVRQHVPLPSVALVGAVVVLIRPEAGFRLPGLFELLGPAVLRVCEVQWQTFDDVGLELVVGLDREILRRADVGHVFEERAVFARVAWEVGVEEDQIVDFVRICYRVADRDGAAAGVAEKVNLFESKLLAEHIEIVTDVVAGHVRWIVGSL